MRVAICSWDCRILTKRAAEGIAECEHALALDRNLADAHSLIGLVRFSSVAPKKQRLTLSRPCASVRATRWLTLDENAGMAKLHLGSYEQAVAWCRRAIEANRNYPQAYFKLAAALAQLGRLDEARSAVKAGLALNPAYTVSRARASWTATERRPDVSGPARAHSRRPAQGGGAGGMKQV